MEEHELNKLKLELGNMMRCISLVTSYECHGLGDFTQEELEEMMYDIPRGFSSTRSCPLRRDDTDEVNAWRDRGKMKETNFILNHLKDQRKMVQDTEGESASGNNWYFSVRNTNYVSK